MEPISSVLHQIHLIEGDLTAYHSVSNAIRASQPQVIVHLAALTPVRLSFEDPFPYIEVNVKGTVNLVHATLEQSPKSKIVYASTAEVYGWQPEKKPFKETNQLNPASPYAVSKEAADQYMQMAVRVYGLRGTILRPNNSYGRRGERGYMTEYLITTMLKGETVYVGAPESVRDYMHVEDHVKAYVLAMTLDEAVGRIFNVSPGNPISNRELTKQVADLVGFKGNIVWDSYPPGYPHRPAHWDPDYLVLDSTEIKSRLKWEPDVSLKVGLKRVIEDLAKS